jgi:hypothetical protein
MRTLVGQLGFWDGKHWNVLPLGKAGQVLTSRGRIGVPEWDDLETAAPSGGVSDGDKGDIVVSGGGTVWQVDAGVIGTNELGGDVTTAGKALLDDASAADQRTTLGLGTLATANSVNDGNWSGADLAVANGGTGASTAAAARTALGLIIGTDVQAFDAQLLDLAGLAFAGNSLKVIRVNAGETGFELATISAGADPAGYTTIVKSANQDVTNLGVTADSEFTFAVVAGGHYAIDMDVYVSGNNTTGDFTMDFQVSAGTMTGKGTCQNLTAAAAVQNIIVTAAAAANTTAIITGAPSASLDDLVAVNVHYAFTASANGTLTFRFGNAAAAAGRTSRVWKGSVMRWKRLD